MSNISIPLDDYDVYEVIGKGGGGAVYRAYHKNLQKQVVIKKSHSQTTNDAIKRAEVDILKNLHHPYLPQVFNYYDIDGISYTVMDFIEGQSFGDMLKAGVRFSEKQVIKYATQLCEAVAYLHSRNIPVIHGDIKPDNVMLTADDNICLIDFNISGITDDGRATTTGYTPGYGAPEQYQQFMEIAAYLKNNQNAMQQKPVTLPVSQTIENSLDDDVTVRLSNDKDNKSQDDIETVAITGQQMPGQTTAEGKQKYLPGASEIEIQANMPKIYIDKRSDVYSVGATIFHMYTGIALSKTDGTTVLNNKSSDGFIYILNKALQANPNDRYQDAGQMLQSLKAIHKHDKRYKRAVVLQNILTILFVLMIGAGVLLISYGKQVLRSEKDDEYAAYIEHLHDLADDMDVDEFDEVYDKAIELAPDRLDAYHEKSVFLYNLREYEEDIEYMDSFMDDILMNYYEQDPQAVAEVYHTYGNCFFELDDYSGAVSAFANAIKYDDDSAEYYVEYAIALVRVDQIDKAKDALADAEDRNVSDYLVSLTRGEIDLAEGNANDAVYEFEECIENANDEYTLARAYVMLGRANRNLAYENGDASRDYADRQIEALRTGVKSVDRNYKSMLLEELAQASIDAAAAFPLEGYEQIAVGTLSEVVSEGWATLTTYNNLVVLNQRIGDYDNASRYLETMIDLYPDDYRVYKRGAFLEVALQSERENADRDYTKFRDYYLQAKDLYGDLSEGQKNDMEMTQLEQAYNEAVAGGWF